MFGQDDTESTEPTEPAELDEPAGRSVLRRVLVSHTADLRRFLAPNAGLRYGSPVRDQPEQSYTGPDLQIIRAAGVPMPGFLPSQDVDGPAALFRDLALLSGAGATAMPSLGYPQAVPLPDTGRGDGRCSRP